ncbi:MAG: hypothetical protein ACI4KA_00060 [Oscillospiraceae bacterium]
MRSGKRTKLCAAAAAAADILMLAAAVVLDILRPHFAAEYTFDKDTLAVSASHPYDMFGIIAAAALVFAAVMAAFVIAGGFVSGGKNTAAHIVGGVSLIIISAAVILFSYLVVRGQQPTRTEFIAYTNDTKNIIIAEEKYSDNCGAVKIFSVGEESGPARLLASTDIKEFSNGSTERYTLEWRTNEVLGIRFYDGNTLRALQVVP